MIQPRKPKGRQSGGQFTSKSSPESDVTLSSDTFPDAIPDAVRAMLPGDTAATWETIAPLMPDSAYLVGGTGLTVHLKHRVSRDLDFLLEQPEDLDALWSAFEGVGKVLASERSDDTLNCLFNGTKVQVLEAATQRLILPTIRIAGLRIASVEDIMATKINVICARGALRDYFDLICIEQQTGLQVEVGISLAIQKYGPRDKENFVFAALHSLGGFDDVDDDPSLPVSREKIQSYWLSRQSEVARRFDSFS